MGNDAKMSPPLCACRECKCPVETVRSSIEYKTEDKLRNLGFVVRADARLRKNTDIFIKILFNHPDLDDFPEKKYGRRKIYAYGELKNSEKYKHDPSETISKEIVNELVSIKRKMKNEQ